MACLCIRVLGPLQVSLDGAPVSGFASDKVRALLAYLALSTDRAHRREALAGLLWPDFPERSARTNLRNALANLRQVIQDRDASPPYLHITRQTIQFNGQSDYWLDADAFEALIAATPPASEELEQAAGLARGLFLEGFGLADATPFEEWLLLCREHFGRQLLEALGNLVAIHEGQGHYRQALAHARRRVGLEPWDEDGQRQLMRVLALSGHRRQALVQYENLCRSLQNELGAEPAQETTRLYEQIRDEELRAPVLSPLRPPNLAVEPPPFLEEGLVEVEEAVFVARERELAQLGRSLDLALAGQARVVLVTGEAGSGKTALVHEFSRRAQDAYPDLIVANGNCNAYSGIGDPYLPFREILELLTGDVEAKRAARAITGEAARRLWHTLPVAVRALVEAGHDLIDTFVPRAALLERARTCAHWPGRTSGSIRLDHLVERELLRMPSDVAPSTGMPGLQQSYLFKQYTEVLKTLARQAPLVLVVDDLQWADAGSISLLFHLGRQLAGSRILIVGAYRPEDVALGRDGARHPLEPVVNELQREFGGIVVNVDQAERRGFLEALVDSESNRLGIAFREMLYRQTHGHPLFTIELLRGLQEQGDLVRDPEGCWVEGPALDWQTLPARVEAVIAERVGRLPDPLQAALRVASVEGEIFTAEVVARVQAADEGKVVGTLSGELDRRHRLVRAQGMQRLDTSTSGMRGGQRLSHYRFRHILFQRYLYNSLDEVERIHLHEAVGDALEVLHGGQTEMTAAYADVAPQLAWHFQEAGNTAKAVHYLRQAGERAVQLSAHQEAITHLTKGLELLKHLPFSPERLGQELKLQTALTLSSMNLKGYGDTEAGQACARALELCEQIGDAPQIVTVLGLLSAFHFTRAEYGQSLPMAERLLSIALKRKRRVRLSLVVGNLLQAVSYTGIGEFDKGLEHAEVAIANYSHHLNRVAVQEGGVNAGVSCRCFAALILLLRGYPHQSQQRLDEAMVLAEDDPYSVAFAQFYSALVSELCRDVTKNQAHTNQLVALAADYEFQMLHAFGIALHGRITARQGQALEGLAQIHRGLTMLRARNTRMFWSYFHCLLAEVCQEAEQMEEGLVALNEGLAFVEQTGERFCEAEIHRLRGELLLKAEGEAVASEWPPQACFSRAIKVARQQGAKLWELRATTNLARLWQSQGRVDSARQMLAEIYGRFTEGFDTPDLRQAKALLESLS